MLESVHSQDREDRDIVFAVISIAQLTNREKIRVNNIISEQLHAIHTLQYVQCETEQRGVTMVKSKTGFPVYQRLIFHAHSIA